MRLKKLLMISLIVCLGLISAACGNSEKSSTPSKSNQTQTTKSKETTSNNSKSTNNNDSSSSAAGTDASTNSDPYAMMVRMDGVINATLMVESKKPKTTVDYKLRTMTQDGKKVSFSLVPNAKHQNDFQEGSIKELIANGDKTNSVTLYNYQIDSANIVSLIDPASNKVIFKGAIQDPSIKKNS
jgi:ABC-type oligopeptide transport system substrate-binding subunit